MNRFYYGSELSKFLTEDSSSILGKLVSESQFDLILSQNSSWQKQIEFLKGVLYNFSGAIYFEYAIPRMGRRIDVIVIIKQVIFILEFKVGEKEFLSSNIEQVWDYALDLKNFHETSRDAIIAPILIASEAKIFNDSIQFSFQSDNILFPICSNISSLKKIIEAILKINQGNGIDINSWINGRYSPTPTIIEAAMALFNNHSVEDISRKDASAENLSKTSRAIDEIIHSSRKQGKKSICLVTGVPGAGKTLVGLDIATKHLDKAEGTTSVFLSGNGPLVAVLREALTRDKVKREKENGIKVRKGEVLSRVKVFIQNVHHFRDEYLKDAGAPFDHVAIFDEAQRAWNLEQTASFMKRKKNVVDFAHSEPEFLISCLDRHKDWSVIVCLVGGGQEINTGEAGITEWIESLNRSFPDWNIYISSRITDKEYAAGEALKLIENRRNVFIKDELHLGVSMRSFRAEHLSKLVKCILDLDLNESIFHYNSIREKYPIVLTRDLGRAKLWLKQKARGSERYGIMVSSQAQRLKPHAIDVKSPMDPIHWFLDGKEDVRSSYYLEDVATEFHVQGLEVDWSCVTWDADFRYSSKGWESYSFVGDKWNNIKKEERRQYLKNAYRVLLTRARQGMVIVVPEGNPNDHTRKVEYYDTTYDYFKKIGMETI